jgi:hypothetical protein
MYLGNIALGITLADFKQRIKLFGAQSPTGCSEMRFASLFGEGAATSPTSPRFPGCYR